MQQTAADPSVADLALDLRTFMAFLHRSAGPGEFATISELELSISQIKALFMLDGSAGEASIGDLAAATGLSIGACSRAMDGLYRAGLVSRDEDPADRRVKRVGLTEAGRGALARIAAARTAGFERLVASLTPRERRRLADALAPILERPEAVACRPRGSR